MLAREVWAVWAEGKIIGATSFSDLQPGMNIYWHNFIAAEFKGKWIKRRLIKTVFNYVFNILNLPKFSSCFIVGSDESICEYLERFGFKKEGHLRSAVKLSDGFHDLILYGMLKEECRWIKGE
jgi:ribosomal-protein-serine acetyltransferase